MEDSFDLSITCENTQIPQSSLAFYLQRLARENSLSAIVIMNGMSLCFVGKNDYYLIIALDSHAHNLLRGHGCSDKDRPPSRTVGHNKTVPQSSV